MLSLAGWSLAPSFKRILIAVGDDLIVLAVGQNPALGGVVALTFNFKMVFEVDHRDVEFGPNGLSLKAVSGGVVVDDGGHGSLGVGEASNEEKEKGLDTSICFCLYVFNGTGSKWNGSQAMNSSILMTHD